MSENPRVYFVIRCVWIVFALVLWIVALNMVTQTTDESAWFMAGLICLIPIAWPVIKFILRAAGVGFAVGASRWDIDLTNGRIYNHGLGGGLIVGLIAVILCIVAGLVILPIYWIIYAIGTTKLGIECFRR